MTRDARAVFVASLVGVAVVAAARGFWALRVVLALLFLAFILACAVRPGVEALRRRGVPRAVGLLLHYAAVAGAVTLAIWLLVPRALHQVRSALGENPTDTLHHAARTAHGIRGAILRALERVLDALPPPHELIHPAITGTARAFHILLGVAFVLGCATFWMLERDRARRYLLAFVPRERRETIGGTWDLVEARLGSYVRAQLLLIAFVASVLSVAFWQIGLPYWLLIGIFAGVVEIVPVVGPLAAAIVAIGVGLTVSTQAAALAAVAVYGLRLLQDYLIGPRVIGHAVALPPLLVLVNVSAVGLLLGPALVPLATPLAAVLATLVDVLLRDRDPHDIELPRVVLPAKE